MAAKHPLKAEPDATPAVFSAFVASAIAFFITWALLHFLAPPVGWMAGRDAPIVIDVSEVGTIVHNAWLRAPDPKFLLPALKFIVGVIGDPVADLWSWGALLPCVLYLCAALAAARICGGIFYRLVYRGLPPVSTVKTVIGQEPLYAGFGAKHINESWLDRRMAIGDGIQLAPGVVMPRDAETEHVAIMGTTGSGKSSIIEGMLQQAIRRGDRALIVDVKGEAAKRFGAAKAGELSIGAGDGPIWAIGRDIRTRQDAIELASILIPASKDPIWSDGARLYLVGLIVVLQRKHGTRWGWRELKNMLARSFHEQERLIRESMPDVVQLLQSKDGDATATVMSLLVTIVANVGSLSWSLAEREKGGGKKISLRQWAAGNGDLRVIFLRLEFDRENQSAAFLKLALRCIQATLLGSTVKDGIDHAIWLGLDELPRFCDDTTVERLVALGRSRGLRILAALQVPAQMRQSLSADATASLLGNFGLQIISRVAPGPSRGEIARDWFGVRTVTWDPALTGAEKGKEWQTKDIPVLTEGELTARLGKFYSATGRPFIRAAVTGFEHVPILDWPIGWADKL